MPGRQNVETRPNVQTGLHGNALRIGIFCNSNEQLPEVRVHAAPVGARETARSYCGRVGVARSRSRHELPNQAGQHCRLVEWDQRAAVLSRRRSGPVAAMPRAGAHARPALPRSLAAQATSAGRSNDANRSALRTSSRGPPPAILGEVATDRPWVCSGESNRRRSRRGSAQTTSAPTPVGERRRALIRSCCIAKFTPPGSCPISPTTLPGSPGG